MLLVSSTRTVLATSQGRYSAAGAHGGYFVTHAAVLPQCCECALPRAVCLKHAALSLMACPVHQHWPAEHLLLSPADKLHFIFQPKDTRKVMLSPLLFLHKYFLN